MSRSRELQNQFDHDYDDQRNIKIGNWLWYTTSSVGQFDVIMIKHQTLSKLMIIVVSINTPTLPTSFIAIMISIIIIIQIDNNEDGDDEQTSNAN